MAQQVEVEQDLNIVALWLKMDPKRWIAGALAGAFAGLVMLAFGMALAASMGFEPLAAVKYAALPYSGALFDNKMLPTNEINPALALGMTSYVLKGLLMHTILCMLSGAVFAHFTRTNKLGPVFGMGLAWGAFSWIFIGNLMSHSFRDIKAADVSHGSLFFAWMIFGVSLCVLPVFDRVIRGNKPLV
jgi:hypothetical protein